MIRIFNLSLYVESNYRNTIFIPFTITALLNRTIITIYFIRVKYSDSYNLRSVIFASNIEIQDNYIYSFQNTYRQILISIYQILPKPNSTITILNLST